MPAPPHSASTVRPRSPRSPILRQRVGRELIGAIDRGGTGRDFAGREVTDRLAQQIGRLAEVEVERDAGIGSMTHGRDSTGLEVSARSSRVPGCGVRGPMNPISKATASMAAAMNTKTPVVPNRSSVKAMRKAVKMAEKRLHE